MKILPQRLKTPGPIRSRRTLFIFALQLVFTGTLSAWFRPGLVAPLLDRSSSVRTLSFGDRDRYQRATEQVYWQHRIWPKENARSKPALDEVMSRAEVENKVQDYLIN